MDRPYKFKLGEVDSFKGRQLVFQTTTVNGAIATPFPLFDTSVRFFNGAIQPVGLYTLYNDAELTFVDVKCSKAYGLFGVGTGQGTCTIYVKGNLTTTWTKLRVIDLSSLTANEFGLSEVLIFDSVYNSYDFKFVNSSSGGVVPVQFYGLYVLQYFNLQDWNIFSDSVFPGNGFEFEINPLTFRHQLTGIGAFAQETMNGVYKTRAASSPGGQIDLHFDFIRGVEEDESYTFRTAAESTKTISALSSADRYKIEYFARKHSKLLLVTDEYVIYNEENGYNPPLNRGRIAYHCIITPGTLKFSRRPVGISVQRMITDSVTGKERNIVYQESYSCDFSLTILEKAL